MTTWPGHWITHSVRGFFKNENQKQRVKFRIHLKKKKKKKKKKQRDGYDSVVVERVAYDDAYARLHDALDLEHPVLDIAGRVDVLLELDLLVLGRVHGRDAHVLLELDLVDVLEAFAQVRLHGLRVLGLREDLEQLVVGQKVEARKRGALRLQVLAQALLHLLQQLVALLELIAQACVRTQADHLFATIFIFHFSSFSFGVFIF